METLTFREPRLVALVLLVIIAAGLSAWLAIGRQEDPTITNLFATVTTTSPGMEAALVESLVTVKIEQALREIAEIDTIESASAPDISIVQIDLIDTVATGRIEGIWAEVRDALSDLVPDFPDGVNPPQLSTDGAGTFGAIVSFSAKHENVPPGILARHSEELAERLRNLRGTALVDRFGAAEEEILVTLHPERAAALGLSADAVSRAILAADSKVQAGRLRGTGNEMILNLRGEITALSRVREVIVAEGANGRITKVADIAEVSREIRRPVSETAIHNARPAVLVAARLDDGLQIDRWMRQVRSIVADYQPDVPASVDMALIFDQSRYTASRLREVGFNMMLGVALVVGVLLLTLGTRAALVVALILPIVSLASLATMNLIGLPIHQMSVTGLIVALGLMVDAGIVMTDEIGQRIRSGLARKQAVEQAVRRLFGPLFASTVTTALSFMPMVLLPGPAGDFVGSIAIAVIIMLLWSLAIALTITPAVAGWVMPRQPGPGLGQSGLQLHQVTRIFRASIRLAVSRPGPAIALSLILPVLGFTSLPLLTAQFFPGVDRDQFTIDLDLRSGASLAQTRAVVERLDALLLASEEVDQLTWVVGRSAPAFYYNIVGDREDSPRHAHALVTTVSPQATEVLIRRLERQVDELVPEAQVLVRGLVQGPPVAAPIELRLLGPDLDTLRLLGNELQRIVSQVPSVTVARPTLLSGGPEVSIEVDEAAARSLSLSLTDIARQLQSSLEGMTGGSLIEGTEQLPVRVRHGDATRADLQAIADLPLVLPNGTGPNRQGDFAGLPLSAVGKTALTPGASLITRHDGQRANTIQVFVLRDVLPQEALKDVQAALAAETFTLPRGYRLELGGDSDARSNTLNNLLAPLGIIITLSIAVIVMTFRSFRLTGVALIVSALSAGLSLLALAIFNYPFGINAIIGVIGSIGVSINAAIIIMTGLQADPAARAGQPEAMTDVIMRSSRHILSTTVTTFAGFLPLILAGGGFWPPFAMAVAGGVLLSSVISFYFVPPMFALVYASDGPLVKRLHARTTPYLREQPQ